jgi:nuclear pore complex protein Nup205
MSFLTRLASTREGAERLMNAELLSKLAQCEYLGAKPQMGSSDMGELILFL